MATVYSELDERLINFISSQPIFFVATAPCLDETGAGGHVNVSPKGYRDTFAILDPLTVAYLDLTGSGAETIAHLRQNGRITIMFCSFDRAPKILRLYGSGRVVLPDEPQWAEFAAYFPADEDDTDPARALIGDRGVDVNRDAFDRPDAQRSLDALDHQEELERLDALGQLESDGCWESDNGGSPDDGWRRYGTGMDRGNRRAIIVTSIDRISDSCGYAVPVMDLVEERDVLARWAERRSAEDLVDYRVKHNSVSIDGLPALGRSTPR